MFEDFSIRVMVVRRFVTL